tara:strand:+ start:4137 stop:4403 length:267 start_codon:yes stop_codon:yes gene_type:complete
MSFSDHKFRIPDDIKDIQSYVKRIDETVQMFGCIIIQDQFSEPKWQYVVKDRIFTVRDMMKMGLGITLIEKEYELSEIKDEKGSSTKN